jgi:hypothetical protein
MARCVSYLALALLLSCKGGQTGPQGLAGADGAPGPTGPRGATGPTGMPGSGPGGYVVKDASGAVLGKFLSMSPGWYNFNDIFIAYLADGEIRYAVPGTGDFTAPTRNYYFKDEACATEPYVYPIPPNIPFLQSAPQHSAGDALGYAKPGVVTFAYRSVRSDSPSPDGGYDCITTNGEMTALVEVDLQKTSALPASRPPPIAIAPDQ